MPVELLVLLLGHLRPGPPPQRGALVGHHRLAVAHHHHRQRDPVRPLAHDRLEAVRLQELVGIGLHVQHDGGARLLALPRLDGVGAAPVRRPQPRLGPAGPARGHLHPVRHHEGGVEPHPELADQARPVPRLVAPRLVALRLVAPRLVAPRLVAPRLVAPRLAFLSLGQRLPERPRAGARDGAQVGHQLVPAHADAVVGDGQRARRLVRRDDDARRVGRAQRLVGQRLEAPPVGGVGRVRHQLAQEDLPLGVQRVHHQVEQPPHLGAELVPLGRCLRGLAHAGWSPASVRGGPSRAHGSCQDGTGRRQPRREPPRPEGARVRPDAAAEIRARIRHGVARNLCRRACAFNRPPSPDRPPAPVGATPVQALP